MARNFPDIRPYTQPLNKEAEQAFHTAMRGLPESSIAIVPVRLLVQTRLEAASLAQQIRSLHTRLERIEDGGSPCVNVVADLHAYGYKTLQPIYVTLEPCESEFVATFADANVSASGETQEDAILNFKDILITLFEHLNGEAPEKLGHGPTHQLEVLRRFVAQNS